jgi:hypothetical protein
MSLKMMEVGPKARFFPFSSLGSFNISGGLSYNTIEGNYGYTGGVSGKFTLPYKAALILGQLGIGNHWVLGNGFTVGADWLTLTPVLSKSYSIEYSNDAAGDDELNQSEKDYNRRGEKALLKQIQAKFLVASIGWSF